MEASGSKLPHNHPHSPPFRACQRTSASVERASLEASPGSTLDQKDPRWRPPEAIPPPSPPPAVSLLRTGLCLDSSEPQDTPRVPTNRRSACLFHPGGHPSSLPRPSPATSDSKPSHIPSRRTPGNHTGNLRSPGCTFHSTEPSRMIHRHTNSHPEKFGPPIQEQTQPSQ